MNNLLLIGGEGSAFKLAKASDEVVVGEAGRLHERVDGGGAYSSEPSSDQVLADTL